MIFGYVVRLWMTKISRQISYNLELNWKSYKFFKFNRLICQVVRVLEIWEINWMG
jgi:hypothetical protein